MVEMTVCCRPGVCKVGNIVDQLMMSVWLERGPSSTSRDKATLSHHLLLIVGKPRLSSATHT